MKCNGQLQVGDRVTAISDENGFHEIDESTDANQVDRLLRGRHNSIVELRMIDGDSKERLVRQRRQLSSQPVSFGDIEFTKGAQDFVVNSRAGAVNRSVNGQVNRFYPTASSSASISPDGKLLALDNYSELVLWDLESDTLVDRLPARVSVFPSPFDTGMGGVVEFSADGRFLAMGTGIRFSSTNRSDLKVWDVATRAEIGTPLFKNEVGISGVVFAPDNRSLVASDRNGVVRIWNTSTWEQQESLQGLSMAVCLDISPDGRWLAQGGPQGIAIWDFQTRTRRHVLREETVWAAIEFSRDGRTLLVNGLDGKVTMWDVETGTSLTSVDTGADVLSGCKLSPDDGKLAVTSWAGDLWVWDVASMEEIDQHPLTIEALFAQGKAQNQDAKFAAAEKSLARVLRTQLKSMPADHKDLIATKSELKRSLKEQDKLPIISKQPSSTSVQLGANVSLSVDVIERNVVRLQVISGLCMVSQSRTQRSQR